MTKILTAMPKRWSQMRFRQRVQLFQGDGGDGRERIVASSGRGFRATSPVARIFAS